MSQSKVDWKKVEEKIRRAVKRAQKKGIGITYGTFGCYEPGQDCCPMTAVCGKRVTSIDQVAHKLKISPAKVWDFVNAFDGYQGYQGRAARLGYKFRKEILGE